MLPLITATYKSSNRFIADICVTVGFACQLNCAKRF
ncbi:hypothetical protein FHS20_004473 [Phyllobacterium endophyticum]|nr:hypothetical protein [Phyllobacterium endophyticum]